MRMHRKLVAGFVTVSLLVGFVGIIGLYANSIIIASFESGEEHFGSIVMASVEVSSYAKRAEGHTMLFLTLNDTVDADKFYQRIASLRNYTSIIDQKAANPEARKIVEEIKNSTENLYSVGDSLIRAYREESSSGGFDFGRHEDEIRDLNRFSSEARSAGVRLAELETMLKTEQENVAKETAASLYNIIFVISIIAFIAALSLGHFISGNISRPVKRLSEAAADIGRGKLEVKVDVSSRDEMGELAESFNRMSSALKKSRKEMEDYSRRLEKDVEEKTASIRKSKAVLEDYNRQLEEEVKERTRRLEESKKKLEEKVDELEKMNRLSVGRELRMVWLKKKVRELESKLGKKGR